jgi:hypothetical protein
MPDHACVDTALPLLSQLKFTHLANRLQNKVESNYNKEGDNNSKNTDTSNTQKNNPLSGIIVLKMFIKGA